ncbi:MAG: helix-turn-helix transcriptional regulator [Bradyrhizobium sp.]|nr:helix-turn-helix transcriptional regulator [Bradyrhizobium sp.]MBJ7404288.1 helix-turn-helix transcriptional regulator [Bradyrhizobium sp.]
MDVRRIVGLNVRRHRLEAEISQEELAARIGVEQYYVSGLEAGKRNITIVTLWRLAMALSVEAAELVARGVHRPQIPSKTRPRGKVR